VSPRPAPDLTARRDRVLGHARRIAEAEGWEAVTIRRLATELGVTQPVLYTAFGKRQDIVDAVALRGFTELAGALGTGDPAAAYLEFARAHPATYEAMFLMPTGLRFAAADVPAPMRVAFTALGRALGIDDDVRTEVAWSLLHGLASLDRAGRLSTGAHGRRLEELERLLGVLTAGLAPGASDRIASSRPTGPRRDQGI
jgi:AcrR family transcriptional regulator